MYRITVKCGIYGARLGPCSHGRGMGRIRNQRTPSDEHGHAELLHEADRVRVPLQAEREAAQPVRRQAVRA